MVILWCRCGAESALVEAYVRALDNVARLRNVDVPGLADVGVPHHVALGCLGVELLASSTGTEEVGHATPGSQVGQWRMLVCKAHVGGLMVR
jgi:hypothetical protein